MSSPDICIYTSDMKIDEEDDIEVSSNGPVLQNFEKKQTSPQDNEESNFTLHLSKKIRIRIYKPLIPLKIVLFCWYGGASFVAPFLFLHLKQHGLTLQEMSLILTCSPVAQFLGTVFSGVLADKLGRSKPILICNLVLSTLFLGGILLVPSLSDPECSRQINLKCDPQQFDRLITRARCDGVDGDIEVSACNVQCPENVTEHCHGSNLICEILAGEEELRNFSLSITVLNRSAQAIVGDRCFYNVSSMSHGNETYSWCNVPHKRFCRVSCFVASGIRCDELGDERLPLLATDLLLVLLFMTTYSNVYRFMDVTAMALVQEHASDFGRERFFSILGMMVVSPIAGVIVDWTTPEDAGKNKNYSSSFYLFGVMVLLVLATVYKLKVSINSPGKKMFKKATYLLKNVDVVSCAMVIFVLGISWSFTKNFMFWYLEGMNAPSLLIGLIPSISALYGLPFLATSRWWVQKIGPTHIFLLGLLGYVVNTTGYSFLTDPWFSLILEATNIFTYHLLWVAIITHAHELAPEGLTATVIATAGSIHYHLGKAFGSLIGGNIMDSFGGRIAFRVMGIVCLSFAVVYSLYLYIRRRCFVVHFVHPGVIKENISSDVPMAVKDND